MTQNKKQAEDLRVRRTRKLLTQALTELTIEKGFAAITVQDLADRAMINRATFYRHYLDKYDLLEKYMNEIYELTAAQEKLASAQMPETDDPPVGMVRMFEQVQQHADFYRVMLSAKGDPTFAQRIQQYSEMRLQSLVPSEGVKMKPKSPPLGLCLSYLSHAGVGVIAWWLNEGQAYSPRQVTGWLTQLNKETLDYVLGEAGSAGS
ncbi:MAG: TetR/AcrR family transcriptional regulator [Anaerolineae bacterium]